MEILVLIVGIIVVILLCVGLSSRSFVRAPDHRGTFGPTKTTNEISRSPDRFFAPRRSDTGTSPHSCNEGVFIPKAPKRLLKAEAPGRFSQAAEKLTGELEGFRPNGLKIDWAAPCYLTGQPISSCRCEECKTWRLKHAQ
jgi:hypothetical protein